MPSRPIGRLFRENSGFSEILTRTLGTITCAGRGWGNLQACHRRAGTFGSYPIVGLTEEGWHSQTTCTAMPGKLWFPRNRGTNMTENEHIRIEKACRGYPLRLGAFSTFGSRNSVGFVVHISAFTAHRSAIPGKLWFLGNFNSNIGHYNMCR